MKRLTTTVMCAVVLGLVGCSMHFHGEAGSGKGSSKSSGSERTAQNKPKPHKHHDHDHDHDVADTSGGRSNGANSTADKPKTDKPSTEPTRPSGSGGGGSTAGQIATKPLPAPPLNVDLSKVPVGGSDPAKKPSSGSGSVAGTIATGGGQPAKPPVSSGAAGAIASGRTDDKPSNPQVGSGAAGAIATGTKPGDKPAKPAFPIKTGAAGTIATNNTGVQSAASRAAAKLAAEAAAARGDNQLPRGQVPKGEAKPSEGPADKNESPSKQPSGAFAMIPATGQSGKGNLRVPAPITGVSCKLSKTEHQVGSAFKVQGEGFQPAAKLTVGGIEVPVTNNKPTLLLAKLPKELANGGDVVLTQGDVVARCGNLKIKTD